MKKLYILRHAKADPDADFSDDHEKPLAKRGHSDCTIIAKFMQEENYIPDYVISSNSLRTTQTTENVLRILGPDTPTHFTYNLYLASPGEILKEISQTNDDVESLLVVGHNPGMHQISSILTGGGPMEHITNLQLKFPTTALACFSVNADNWQQIDPGSGILDEFITPKMMKTTYE